MDACFFRKLLCALLTLVAFPLKSCCLHCTHVVLCCSLGWDRYYFSLTTMMTIGYGTQDQFFDGCWQALVLIVLQSLLGMFLDVLCFGFIYTRLANPSNRATTVCFSERAVLREINGQFYFMCQALEMRKHHLVEASVRMYVVIVVVRCRRRCRSLSFVVVCCRGGGIVEVLPQEYSVSCSPHSTHCLHHNVHCWASSQQVCYADPTPRCFDSAACSIGRHAVWNAQGGGGGFVLSVVVILVNNLVAACSYALFRAAVRHALTATGR